MNPSHLGQHTAQQPPTEAHTHPKAIAQDQATVAEPVRKANAAKRAGLTQRDFIRMQARGEALAKLEGKKPLQIPLAEAAVRVRAADVQGSHRALAEAKLEGSVVAPPVAARGLPPRQGVQAVGALAAPVAALEAAVRAVRDAEREKGRAPASTEVNDRDG